jgi:predicted PurR-regulated permease PerM
MVVIATWPAMLKLQVLLGGKRSLAAVALTVALLLVLIVPLGVALWAVVGNLDAIAAWTKSLQTITLPVLPAWVAGIPLAGPKLEAAWQSLAAAGPDGLLAQIQPHMGQLLEWFAGQVGSMGGMILQFLLTVAISGILYMHGEAAARGVLSFASRLAGQRGEQAALLAAGAIRGVAMGVVLTALAQTVVAGTGLAIASVPAAAVLAAVILVLCLAQIGPSLVMLPVVIWKYSSGDPLWGTVLLVFAIVSGGMDNFVRPALIRRGADLPILLILSGVIGGLISFGIMGIFIGPVILAVTYTLLADWVASKPGIDAESAAEST